MGDKVVCNHFDLTWETPTWCKRIYIDGYEYLLCLECGTILLQGETKWKQVEVNNGGETHAISNNNCLDRDWETK